MLIPFHIVMRLLVFRRQRLFRGLFSSVVLVVAAATQTPAAARAPQAPARDQALEAMKRATTFMMEKVSYKGGFVWSYLPDLSRRWGEMEAYPTMIWMQSGTPSMGNLFLDAYQATKDEYYYQAAEKVAGALIQAQHSSGGWNYVADLSGEDSLKTWYATIGKNGWRLEEFQHYYGNATFDDSTTSDSARFMLRIYLEKKDPKYKASLDKAIQFVLDSQHPVGGWPQRFPPMGEFTKDGNPDYTSFITFNDEVAVGNIDFLILCYRILADQRLLNSARRGMDAFLVTQQPAPQAGWGLQHTIDDLKPAGARTYEPRSLVTSTTVDCVEQLIRFYYMTGEKRFLARIPEALDWLDSVRLPANTPGARGSHARFVEVGTNKPLFVHRTGSNVANGKYFADYDSRNTIGHYSSFQSINVERLRELYQRALATPPAEATKDSPLRAVAPSVAPPPALGGRGGPGFGRGGGDVGSRAAQLIASLNAEGYWPSPIRRTSHPYKGDGSKEVAPGDFSSTQVGDEYDTSPFAAGQEVMGISISTYIANMGALIECVNAQD